MFKIDDKSAIQKYFSGIFSDGHLRYSFDRCAIIFPKKVQDSLLKVRKIQKNSFSKQSSHKCFL